MTQPTLFRIAETGQGGETVHPIGRPGIAPQEDAVAMQSEAKVGGEVRAILECLLAAGEPLLAEEIAERTGILRHVVPARLHPMEHIHELIRKPVGDDGEPKRRLASTGIRCFVYAITRAGEERLRT